MSGKLYSLQFGPFRIWHSFWSTFRLFDWQKKIYYLLMAGGKQANNPTKKGMTSTSGGQVAHQFGERWWHVGEGWLLSSTGWCLEGGGICLREGGNLTKACVETEPQSASTTFTIAANERHLSNSLIFFLVFPVWKPKLLFMFQSSRPLIVVSVQWMAVTEKFETKTGEKNCEAVIGQIFPCKWKNSSALHM